MLKDSGWNGTDNQTQDREPRQIYARAVRAEEQGPQIRPADQAEMARPFAVLDRTAEKPVTKSVTRHNRSVMAFPLRTCERCEGLLVPDGYSRHAERCVQCGNVVDATILRNRTAHPLPHGHKEPRRYSVPLSL